MRCWGKRPGVPGGRLAGPETMVMDFVTDGAQDGQGSVLSIVGSAKRVLDRSHGTSRAIWGGAIRMESTSIILPT